MADNPNTSATSEILIERLCMGGRGLGRMSDGRVVFVPLVLPNERVRIRPRKATRSYVEAELVELIEPSPVRSEPACPHFGQCGGCDWQHLPYVLQLATKQRLLADEVERQLGIRASLLEPVASPLGYGYRSHARLHLGAGLGFQARGSHRVVAISNCPILNKPLKGCLERLRGLRLERLGFSSIDLMAPGDEVLVQFNQDRPLGRDSGRLAEELFAQLAPAGLALRSLRGGQISRGSSSTTYAVDTPAGPCRVRATFGGFVQANMAVNALLLEHVASLLGGTGEVLELFSGSGNLSLPLARRCGHVSAVEINTAQVRQARDLARENGITNVDFRAGDAYEALAAASDCATVLIDPPREGAREVAERLAQSPATRLVYVSCDPATLMRDLKLLTAGGFELESLRLFDMFPQTSHIEAVASLHRSAK